MIDTKTDGGEAEAPTRRCSSTQRGILAGVCALVIGVYAYTAHSGFLTSQTLNPADAYYNLLVQGFRAGQLNLKIDVPPGLAQRADPYGPVTSASYSTADMSCYKGKLYLYFGVTPALVLFWPYVALTGHYLLQKDAAVIFCLIGFLTSADLLYALWRRYFAEVSVAVVAAVTLALGLVTFTPLLLARCDVFEVPVSCGYAFAALALAAIWKALHHPSQRERWLAAASLAYGLALGARPSMLFGSAVLLVPVAQAWRERRKVLVPLLAATGPIALIGLGLMLYNWLRFDSSFEFGLRYQLAGEQQLTKQLFSLRYLWFNFRVYFLQLAHWSGRFPFVHDSTVPPLPAGHGPAEQTFGVLTNVPFVWLALAVPLAWRDRSAEARSTLRGFLATVAMLFGIGALTLGLFCYATGRYESEFLPALVLLAAVGVLSLERALARLPAWRRRMRWIWGILLVFSVVFNLLASVERCGEAHYYLGRALERQGRMSEATAQYEQALRLKPDYARAHRMLADRMLAEGKIPEAIAHYKEALSLNPGWVEVYNNLGFALGQMGKLPEAIEQFEQALQIDPNSAECHCNLAVLLARQGDLSGALGHFEQALQSKPNYAEACFNLGLVLEKLGRTTEAVQRYQQALALRPDFLPASNALMRVQANRMAGP